MVDFEEIFDSPAFWILCATGISAFLIMLIVLAKMGQASIMPWWVKVITILVIPIAAALFSGWASGD
jgi:hypothetical protein